LIVGGGSKKQNMKTLKKFVALMTLAALVAGPAQALAQASSGTIITGLSTGDYNNTSHPLVVKAKWELRKCLDSTDITNNGVIEYDGPGTANDGWYCEDKKGSTNPGSQVYPSGDSTVNTNMLACQLVYHGSLEDWAAIDAAAYVKYPNYKGYGASKQFCNGTIDGGLGKVPMAVLTEDASKAMVCGCGDTDGIKNADPYLPEYNTTFFGGKGLTTVSSYLDEICNDEFTQHEVRVYCGNFNLSYEAPAGNYEVKATVDSTTDHQQAFLENVFKYLQNVSFAVDFDGVDYGAVVRQMFTASPNGGDADMATSENPSIKAMANQLLKILVTQDDMDLGYDTVAAKWNVKYKARMGSTPAHNVTDWASVAYYNPEATAWVKGWDGQQYLDLSDVQKLDFGVFVDQWRNDITPAPTGYEGTMVISAEKGGLIDCGTSQQVFNI